MRTGRWSHSAKFLALASVALLSDAAFADTKIGVAATVKDQVFGSGQQLSVGSPIHAQEIIKTGETGSVSLQFLDQTNLNIGPKSELTLDRFVYDPNRSKGNVVINTGKGVFRFVSGSQAPQNYKVNTPVATIGIRGTSFYIFNWPGHSAVVQHYGETIINHHGQTVYLTTGHSLIISSNGHHELFNSKETSSTLHKSGIDQASLQQYSNFVGQAGNPLIETLPPVQEGGEGGHHHHHHHHHFYGGFGHHHHHNFYFGHHHHHSYNLGWNGPGVGNWH